MNSEPKGLPAGMVGTTVLTDHGANSGRSAAVGVRHVA